MNTALPKRMGKTTLTVGLSTPARTGALLPRAKTPSAAVALGAALLGVALLGGCRVERETNYEWLPWINYMFFSPAAETNTRNPVFRNHQTNQVPPAGTIPRGFVPLHYSADDAGRTLAGQELHNPEKATPETLARGKVVYDTFCLPCHGTLGAGDGPVSKRGMPGFPIGAPDNNAAKWPDGYLFHILSYGRGNMPSYASQINQDDRWKAILYLRQLQATAKPTATP